MTSRGGIKAYAAASFSSIVSLSLVLAGCQPYEDVTIENPCSEARRIETFDYPPEDIAGKLPNRAVWVPANSSVEIENAYGHTREDEWSVRIVGYGAVAIGPENNVVVIPVAACD